MRISLILFLAAVVGCDIVSIEKAGEESVTTGSKSSANTPSPDSPPDGTSNSKTAERETVALKPVANETPVEADTDKSPVSVVPHDEIGEENVGVSETPDKPRQLADVIADVEQSVVRIETNKGLGSGFVVFGSDKILTNYHVVDGATEATCVFLNGRRAPVLSVHASDHERDFAVISVKDGVSVPGLKIASSLPRKGVQVIACGNPQGLSFTATEGIVSAIRTPSEFHELALPFNSGTWIQTSAPISGGNSGGPLVDLESSVIGMNTSSLRTGNNLNFAISCLDLEEAIELASMSDGISLTKFAATAGDQSSAGSREEPGFGQFEVGSATSAADRRAMARKMFPAIEDKLDNFESAEAAVFECKMHLKEKLLGGAENEAIERAMAKLDVSVREAQSLASSSLFNEVLSPRSLKTGQVGHFRGDYVDVFQIIDKSQGILLGHIGSSRFERVLVKLRGVDVSSVTDGTKLGISDKSLFLVYGTDTYATVAGGTNTVFELVMLGSKDTDFAAQFIDGDALTRDLILTDEERQVANSKMNKVEIWSKARRQENQAKAKIALAERMLKMPGRRDNGISWLLDVVEEFPDTEAAALARERLSELGVSDEER